MGFQINGTEVLGSNGIVNHANSFVTIGGTSVAGTGNITDTGSDALGFNTVGSYTVAGYGESGQTAEIDQTGSFAASNLWAYTNAAWNVTYTIGAYVTYQTHSSNADHNLSGTWKHKCRRVVPRTSGGRLYFTLWQRIS